MDFHASRAPSSLPQNVVDMVAEFVPDITTRGKDSVASDCLIEVVLQKTLDIPFVAPIDVPTGTATDIEELRNRYWTVFKPDDLETAVVNSQAKKRAEALLPVIEGISGRMAEGHWTADFVQELTRQQNEAAFRDAFARDPSAAAVRLSHVEKYVQCWAPMIPDDPRVYAALIHDLAAKYGLRPKSVPSITAILRFKDPDVRDAYDALYGAPIDRLPAPTNLRPRVRALLRRQ